MASPRIFHWRGVDPERAEVALVRLGADRLEASGSSVTEDYLLTYQLTTREDWMTNRLEVIVQASETWRRLRLERSPTGRWHTMVETSAEGRSEPVGLPGLEDAVDCDLAHCPLTNTMPIRRRDLVAAAQRSEQHEAIPMTMAWVSVPDLTIHQSSQTYRALRPAPDGGAYVEYRSGDFTAEIEVDASGVVVEYPGVARRIDP